MTDLHNTSVDIPRKMTVATVLPVGLFVLLAIGFFYALSHGDPHHLPSALIGKPAPSFRMPAIPAIARDGVPVEGLATADLAAGGVTIVNFWASWCAECRQEHALLQTLPAKLGVRIFGVDQKDKTADAAAYLTSLGNPYQKIGADGDGRVSIDWGVYGVPETYVVDGMGKISFRYIGPLTPESIEAELRPAVEQARKAGQ